MYLTPRDMKLKQKVYLHQLQYSESPNDEKSLNWSLL